MGTLLLMQDKQLSCAHTYHRISIREETLDSTQRVHKRLTIQRGIQVFAPSTKVLRTILTLN